MTKRSHLVPALLVLALVLAALAAACAAVRQQHAPAASAVEEPPELPPATPASETFKGLSSDQQLAEVRGEVQATKRALREAGKYECCVMPACNQCLLKDGECHCRRAVEKEGGPCCGECTEAWLEGRGVVEGIDPWELLERKKKEQSGKPEAEGEKPPAKQRHEHDHHDHRHLGL
jgi:hypothetical protein